MFSFLTKTVVVEIKVQTYMWPFKISAAKKPSTILLQVVGC